MKNYLKRWKSLPKEDIIVIQQHTELQPEAIKKAHKDFKKEYPDEKVPWSALVPIFDTHGTDFCNVMKKVMDPNDKGFVKFTDLLICASTLEYISNRIQVNEKVLRWLFRSFDFDRSDTISMEEFVSMAEFLKALHGKNKEEDSDDSDSESKGRLAKFAMGIEKRIYGLVEENTTHALFKHIDVNQDKVLTEDEFIQGMNGVCQKMFDSDTE